MLTVRRAPVGAVPKGRGRTPPGEMNTLEAAYAAHLEGLRLAGDVAWYAFEGVKFRLAAGTFYTPDFLVMRSDGLLEVHEVKGHWEDDARVKVKVAARLFPVFSFFGVTREGRKGAWKHESF